VVSVLVAAVILSVGGWRQAPLQADTNNHQAKVHIGTACEMDRGAPQICR
jgi:hypothetical protein